MVDIPSVVVEIHGRIHRMGIDDCYQGRAGVFEGRQEKVISVRTLKRHGEKEVAASIYLKT